MKTLPYEGSQLQRDIAATSSPEHLNKFRELSESAVRDHKAAGKTDSVKFFESAIADINKKLKPRKEKAPFVSREVGGKIRRGINDGGTGHGEISYSDADPGL